MKLIPYKLIILILTFSSFSLNAQSIDYFSILSPNELIGIYLKNSDFSVANFGNTTPLSNITATGIIAPNDYELLCTNTNFDFKGKIAVIPRGECEFGLKAYKAQNYGAIAVIIVSYDKTLVPMGPGISGDSVTIPVIMIRQDVGDEIINSLRHNEEVILSLGPTASDFKLIQGNVIFDLNKDCLTNQNEKGIENWKINLDYLGTGKSSIIFSDSKGYFKKFVSPLSFPVEISIVPTNYAWEVCNPNVKFGSVTNDTINYDFEVQKKKDCIELHTEISADRLRRCIPTNFVVKVCNLGTLVSNLSYVDIALAPQFTNILSSNIQFIEINQHKYRFQLGDISPNECKSIFFSSMINCDTNALNRSFCYSAHAFPDTSCIEINSLWSGADIELNGLCNIDSVEFTLINVGQGNMKNPGTYIILKDDNTYKKSTFQLPAGGKKKISLPKDGSTWHIEATQELYHPLSTSVSATLEACSHNDVFSTGYFNMFPIQKNGFAYDEECQEARNSYDPNEKEAFPIGFGDNHFITDELELEYIIRFQNTGNDTAYKIIVVDPLPQYLDPRTVHSITSSHIFDLEITDKGELVFTFNNILLPDSSRNHLGSNGFISFKIKQMKNNTPGTLILNNALIYFDYNSPVETKYTIHEIGEVPSLLYTINNRKTNVLQVYPNPVKSTSNIQLTLGIADFVKWNLINLQGQIVNSGNVIESKIDLFQANELKGLFILELLNSTGINTNIKIVLY